MLAREEKRLLKKLTKAVGVLISKANNKWTDREISELSKVPPNRLTEYKNFDKYQRSITMDNFVKLLGGGFFIVEDVINVAEELTEAEKRYLRDMNFYENSELRKLIISNKKRGVDPVALNRLVEELNNSGIDPMEILRSAKKNI